MFPDGLIQSSSSKSTIFNQTSSKISTFQTEEDGTDLLKLELPDLNRFTSTPQSIEHVSASTCSKDILNPTQFYLVEEDSEDQLIMNEEAVERRTDEENNNLKIWRGKCNILSELPPLPMEEELFVPPADRTNRKEKSIKVLVEALIAMMPEEGCKKIKLDEIAMKLGTNIKRVYSICHVMEVLKLMNKQSRNMYEWQGWMGMMPSLVVLRQMAENQDMIGQLMKTTAMLDKETKLNLNMLTEKLLMMFLVLPQPKILSLSVASTVIIGPNSASNEKRCSLQRLGDIAHILQTVGLLKKVKVKVGDERKVFAYQYVGQEVELVPVVQSEENILGQVERATVKVGKEKAVKERKGYVSKKGKKVKKKSFVEDEESTKEQRSEWSGLQDSMGRKFVRMEFVEEGLEKILNLKREQ